MSEKKIRTRFAPSPTGPLHIGGVRTALYSYLFAKKHGGDFLLRIEDTDQNRFVPGSEEYIIESLKWCGIEPCEGVGFGGGSFAPYRQSERKPMYRQYAEQLVQSGHAYFAFDTSEELEALRKKAEEAKSAFSYNAEIRMALSNSLTLLEDDVVRRKAAGEHYVIRLKVPQDETITFTDLIRGEISFQSNTVDDKVLLKSDGMPTYHLAHIVDDYLMQITHAIRGEEWLPSAPAHILIYRYLGWENVMPHYAHLPLLLKPDGNGKLSKRDGDRLGFPVFPLDWNDPVTAEKSSGYRERGYYPEAFVNMLAFLGWNPGTEKEIFSMDELIAAFSIEQIQHAGAKFDPEKAKWFNEQHLRNKPDIEIANNIRASVAKEFSFDENDIRLSENFLCKAVSLLKPRVQFENEMQSVGNYLFVAPSTFDEQVISKKWKEGCKEFFSELQNELSSLDDFTAENAKQLFETVASKNNLKPGEVLQLFRVLLIGQAGGVDLFGMVELLGRDETCRRIESALKQIDLE
ncbi:MAG: glutamate--tRNA ligase [Flavobacteriales bacterium]|nr:glutamate--tRNA ligase [Flavobacteriales bacterium]